MKIVDKRLLTSLVAVGFSIVLTSTAFAAGGGLFEPITAVLESAVGEGTGALGRVATLLILMGMVLAVWMGVKHIGSLGMALVYIALFFGAAKLVDFIISLTR